eukprot:9819921-Alexandrium_andersonii.AAC.1
MLCIANALYLLVVGTVAPYIYCMLRVHHFACVGSTANPISSSSLQAALAGGKHQSGSVSTDQHQSTPIGTHQCWSASITTNQLLLSAPIAT